MRDSTTTRAKGIIRGLLAAVFWLAVWQAGSLYVGSGLMLPGPITAARRLIAMAGTEAFWLSTAFTLLEILLGFTLGVVVGSLLALLTWASSIADTLLSPALRLVRSTPVASFIILALLFLTRRTVPMFISALMVTPILWSATRAAMDERDQSLLEMAHVYRFSPWKTFCLIYLPKIMPQWTAACTTAIGLAWKSGVSAEVIAQPSPGIGTSLYLAKLYLNTDELFAWTAMVILLSYILERLFVFGMSRLGRRLYD